MTTNIITRNQTVIKIFEIFEKCLDRKEEPSEYDILTSILSMNNNEMKEAILILLPELEKNSFKGFLASYGRIKITNQEFEKFAKKLYSTSLNYASTGKVHFKLKKIVYEGIYDKFCNTIIKMAKKGDKMKNPMFNKLTNTESLLLSLSSFAEFKEFADIRVDTLNNNIGFKITQYTLL